MPNAASRRPRETLNTTRAFLASTTTCTSDKHLSDRKRRLEKAARDGVRLPDVDLFGRTGPNEGIRDSHEGIELGRSSRNRNARRRGREVKLRRTAVRGGCGVISVLISTGIIYHWTKEDTHTKKGSKIARKHQQKQSNKRGSGVRSLPGWCVILDSDDGL